MTNQISKQSTTKRNPEFAAKVIRLIHQQLYGKIRICISTAQNQLQTPN
jgi:hypothetical protein